MMQGYYVLQLYRAAHWLWHNHSHVLALALQPYISEVFQTIFSLSLSSGFFSKALSNLFTGLWGC
jgi:serine acetyltransferase